MTCTVPITPVSATQALPLQRRWWIVPLLVGLLGLLAVHAATYVGFHSKIRAVNNEWSWSDHPGWSPAEHRLMRWDGIRYWQIADHGYRFDNEPVGVTTVNWFPLYPMLARGLRAITGWSIPTSLAVLSNLAALVACVWLYRLTAALFPRQRWAPLLTLIGWLVQPMAVFLFATYTESLFAVCFCGFAWAVLVQNRPWHAALWAGIACLLRPTGVVLVAILFAKPLATLVVQPSGCQRSSSRVGSIVGSLKAELRAWWPAACVAFLPFVGHAVFLAVNTGDPLMILHIQRWQNVGLTPENFRKALNIRATVRYLLKDWLSPEDPTHVHALENATAPLMPLVLAWMFAGWWRMRRGVAAALNGDARAAGDSLALPGVLVGLCLLLWVLPFFAHPSLHYEGMGRYIWATALPVWMLLGARLAAARAWWRWLAVPVALASAVWMLAVAVRFAQGFWVG